MVRGAIACAAGDDAALTDCFGWAKAAMVSQIRSEPWGWCGEAFAGVNARLTSALLQAVDKSSHVGSMCAAAGDDVTGSQRPRQHHVRRLCNRHSAPYFALAAKYDRGWAPPGCLSLRCMAHLVLPLEQEASLTQLLPTRLLALYTAPLRDGCDVSDAPVHPGGTAHHHPRCCSSHPQALGTPIMEFQGLRSDTPRPAAVAHHTYPAYTIGPSLLRVTASTHPRVPRFNLLLDPSTWPSSSSCPNSGHDRCSELLCAPHQHPRQRLGPRVGCLPKPDVLFALR